MAWRNSSAWKHLRWCENLIHAPLIRSMSTKEPQCDTPNISWLQRYSTNLVCTRWLGGVRVRRNTCVGVKPRSASHLSDGFLRNSLHADTLDLSRLQRYIIYIVCTRWLGGFRVRGNTCVHVKRDIRIAYPMVFYKIASTWAPLTSHDYNGIVLTLYALDGSEESEFVETRVFM